MLHALFVAPGSRRQGAATRLLGAAERWAHSRGARVLVCEIDAAQSQRREALAWLGFSEPQQRLRMRRPVNTAMDTLPESGDPAPARQPAAYLASPEAPPPAGASRRAPGLVFVAVHALLLVCALLSFTFTDIFSNDPVRGVLLPLLDVALLIYFAFLFLVVRYRRRADSSARAERLFGDGR